ERRPVEGGDVLQRGVLSSLATLDPVLPRCLGRAGARAAQTVVYHFAGGVAGAKTTSSWPISPKRFKPPSRRSRRKGSVCRVHRGLGSRLRRSGDQYFGRGVARWRRFFLRLANLRSAWSGPKTRWLAS